MFGTHFYHEKTKKAVAIFGRLFNNIYVLRKNSSGAVISQLKVPLSYAPKQKYLERIRENPDLTNDTKVAIKLPRMSFEITSIAYDNARQLAKSSAFKNEGTSVSTRQKFFTPVPYSINFQLNAYAKSQDDALQIVEQILPTFNPQYTITIKPFANQYPGFLDNSNGDDTHSFINNMSHANYCYSGSVLVEYASSPGATYQLDTKTDANRANGYRGTASHRLEAAYTNASQHF